VLGFFVFADSRIIAVIMKRIALVALILIVTMLLGCSPTLPLTQQAAPPVEAETPASNTTAPTTSNVTPPSPTTTPILPTPPTQTQTKSLPVPDAFQKGMNFGDWKPFDFPTSGLYPPAATSQSLRNLANTGTNWIALIVKGGQETIQSTNIFYKPPATATDSELTYVIETAHALGMKVMLKPLVHLSRDPTHYHGQVGTNFTEEQWQAWFASYQQFIIHYATLARDAGADMFSIGEEMYSTIYREADWRSVAQAVRQVYKGPILYEATVNENPALSEEMMIKWWDAVDYIGVRGYFPLTRKNNPTVEELKTAWTEQHYLFRLEYLSQQFQKTIIISEIGYQSSDGTNTEPGNFKKFATAPLDLQEQADCYQAALEVLWGKPWLKGIFWWQWSATSAPWLESPRGKPAEEVLKKFYLSQAAPILITPATLTPTRPLPPLDAFMKGIHFCDWNPSGNKAYHLYGPGTEISLKDLADTGANWISLLVNGSQDTPASTAIFRDPPRTATDSELLRMVKLAHSLGMRVVLLPALYNMTPEPSKGWWEIGTAFASETQWQEWFASYREFINHYASFAQESGVDMLYVGSELAGTTHREEDWRRVVKEVRERYKGPIGYDSVFWPRTSPEYRRIKWWDAVDYVSTDAWYSLTNKNDPTVAELKEGWIRTGFLTDLENLSRQLNKPVIISEIGYPSFDGTNIRPLDWKNTKNAPTDLQEQADCYQAAFEMLWGKPWLKGIFWWQWTATWVSLDSPQGKPAEEVLKKFYLLR